MPMDHAQAMAARLSVTACTPQQQTSPTEHKPICSDLLKCLCKSVCIVGCWKSSVLAKRISHMHAKTIFDSNSNSNLYTLRVHLVLTLCYYLCWWSFLPPASAFTLVAHVVLTLCYLHWWSFSTSNYRIYSTATCGGPIVTCTVWWYSDIYICMARDGYTHYC